MGTLLGGEVKGQVRGEPCWKERRGESGTEVGSRPTLTLRRTTTYLDLVKNSWSYEVSLFISRDCNISSIQQEVSSFLDPTFHKVKDSLPHVP